jgi:hypothetical protein
MDLFRVEDDGRRTLQRGGPQGALSVISYFRLKSSIPGLNYLSKTAIVDLRH